LKLSFSDFGYTRASEDHEGNGEGTELQDRRETLANLDRLGDLVREDFRGLRVQEDFRDLEDLKVALERMERSDLLENEALP
jgi:hypothetical protein